MFRNRSVNVHQFSMVPRASVPRSTFTIEHTHKTTFDAGWLIPIYVDEVLPGDTFGVKMTAFARMATPIFPVMDNLYLDSFFFFVPNRLLWTNWKRFMGEQDNPDDSTDYVVPEITSPVDGYPINSLYDHMGLPVKGQVAAGMTVTHSALHLRAYNLIWNEWFRDENLQDSIVVNKGDGPDNPQDYYLKKRGKRHDYFTGALPWPQKGESVKLPLGTSAPVTGFLYVGDETGAWKSGLHAMPTTGDVVATTPPPQQTAGLWVHDAPGTLSVDLTNATAATINQLRQSFQIQKLLERDARGGTRYTELVRSHFGVLSPDARLQRPEYLGGGTSRISINPVAQTSGSPGATGYTDTPMGTLSAIGTAVAPGHGFRQSFTEHGVILGLVCVRADLTYQQGMRKMWKRRTRFDYYFPVFAMLGEQAILNREIFCDGSPNDDLVFGYQERWAEYRYTPSMITGQFRSCHTQPLDAWHFAQNFTSLPTLNATFIEESPPLERALAVGAAAGGQQFICDAFFSARVSRPMPMYSVPGLIDHF